MLQDATAEERRQSLARGESSLAARTASSVGMCRLRHNLRRLCIVTVSVTIFAPPGIQVLLRANACTSLDSQLYVKFPGIPPKSVNILDSAAYCGASTDLALSAGRWRSL
jgi:hypothetical protein